MEGEGGGGQSASPVSFVRALKFDLSATGPNARGTAYVLVLPDRLPAKACDLAERVVDVGLWNLSGSVG